MERESLQRDQGVESRCAGDVYEREADYDDGDERQGVHGEFERWMDLFYLIKCRSYSLPCDTHVGEEMRERQAIVFCEHPDQTGYRGEDVEKTEEEQDTDHGDERVGGRL